MGNSFVICYHCYEKNNHILAVFDGCSLCRKFGNGKGLLKQKFADRKLVVVDKTFKPPKCTCQICLDTKTVKYLGRDANPYRYPLASIVGFYELPCHSCDPIDHKVKYDQLYAQQYRQQKEIVLALDFLEPELVQTLLSCQI
ncbi:MAG: hypothetical protein Edafosvirus7_37 [Edafosvirus sp.]|uniref:Uncharacterized protein n=1 Tax=Edafosvirus sp. TaxID=2487765 RepID=A0A3G4ZTM3_9VIRU|nr:MAG: hypothetical protein Edafosvirus7_37 [Edafosvirus sp.]